MAKKTFYTVANLAKAVPMNTCVVREWAYHHPKRNWQFDPVEFAKIVIYLKANFDQVCDEYDVRKRAKKSGKPMTKATLEAGAVCVVPQRFRIPEHRGKHAALVNIGSDSDGLRFLTIQFADGVECRCTTDDIAPLHFSMP